MRVIAGTARKKPLCASQQDTMQPTIDRVKEALFSRLQFNIEGRACLDLFAGSGQLGIEALSRGAKSCDFVEATREAADCIRKNIASCGFERQSRLVVGDSFEFIKNTSALYDIVFLDPPFCKGMLPAVLPLVARKLCENGIVYCESRADEPELPTVDGLERYAESRYGTIRTTFYKKQASDSPSAGERNDSHENSHLSGQL